MKWTTLLAAGVSSLLIASVASAKTDGPAQSALRTAALATPETQGVLTLEQRADIFMARKDYAQAVEYYTRALEQEPHHGPEAAPLWNKMGIAYQQQDEFQAARKAYKRALHFNKGLAEAWNNLGTTYFLANDSGKSIKYYEHAVALNPGSASFHLNLGTSYTRMKKYKQAVEEYRVALTLDPAILVEHSSTGSVVQPRQVDVDYFFYLAKVFASLGRTVEAVRYLRRAFEDGFTNYKRLDEDPDFLKISKDPAYIALRSNPPAAIKD